ncbi:MAG: TerB family tellurite resistance protein [Pseudomonadota bacterium]|jgi:uncharacterized tellurite resistance protein B-like protein
MLGRLLSGLSSPRSAPRASEAPLALAALLVRLARADDAFSDDERRRIDKVLSARYGLSSFEAAALRRGAEDLEAEAPDTVRFTRALKDAVPHEDRVSLVESLWIVALADGSRDPEEEALIRLVCSLLGINDRDSALARQRVTGKGPA